MIPTLEELRRSLLRIPEMGPEPYGPAPDEQPIPIAPTRNPAPSPSRSPRPPRPADARPFRHPFLDILEDDDDTSAEADAGGERAAGESEDTEKTTTGVALDVELSKAIAMIFGSSAAYEEHLARVADATQSIRQMNRVVDKTLGPLKTFQDKMQRLKRSYEAARPTPRSPVFRKTFGRLSRLEALPETFDRTAVAVAGHLFELSKSLGSAKALHERLLIIAQKFEAADALHARLSALSQVLEARRKSASRDGRKPRER